MDQGLNRELKQGTETGVGRLMKRGLLLAGLAVGLNAGLVAWMLKPYLGPPPPLDAQRIDCLFCGNPGVQRALRQAELAGREQALGTFQQTVAASLLFGSGNLALLAMALLRRRSA